MTIRVFVVDDHALVRAGMRMILSGETDIEVVGEADCGEDALPLIRKLVPDVVLCDLHLPGVSGLELTERILKGDHGTRVIVVSVLEDGPMPKRLLEIGASGYVGKGGDASELLRAVREVARGKRYLANSVAQNLALYGIDGDGSPFDALSARELEVAMLLTQGLRQEDLARRLSRSACNHSRIRSPSPTTNLCDRTSTRSRPEVGSSKKLTTWSARSCNRWQ